MAWLLLGAKNGEFLVDLTCFVFPAISHSPSNASLNLVHYATALHPKDTAVKSSILNISSSSCSHAIPYYPIKSCLPIPHSKNHTDISSTPPQRLTKQLWNNSRSFRLLPYIPLARERILLETPKPRLMRIKSYRHFMPYPIKKRISRNAWIVYERRMALHAMLSV